MDYEQIAQVTGCRLGTVKSRIYYAKRALRRILERSFWMFRCWWASLACVAGALVGLMLAGISTVGLILAARRATIRHVNACQIEISEQLKRLQPPTSDVPSGES